MGHWRDEMHPIDHPRTVNDDNMGLLKLGAGRSQILARLDLHSFRDLVAFPPLIAARILVAQCKGGLSTVDLNKYLTPEFVTRDVSQAAGWPLSALQAIDDHRAMQLAKVGINNLADLAGLGDEADAAIAAVNVDNGFSERPSAPAALIPSVIGSVASSVRYTSFAQDADVRGFRFEVDENCFYALPLSPAKKKSPAKPLSKNPGKAASPSLADVFSAQHCPMIQLGYVFDHRQRWINLGTHLGEVVHSVSLAPGESRNIAMVNWRRRHLTSIEQRTTTQEQLVAIFVQNRALEEVASAVAQEHQQGRTRTEANTLVTAGAFVAAGAALGGIALGTAGAVTLGVAGGVASGSTLAIAGALAGGAAGAALGAVAGGAAGGMVFSGAKALGMIESSSDGDRDIASTMQQRITLSTSQNASAVRSVWSTAVVEDVQAESVEASARNITNYNHMHALNVEYYEVLQRYLTQLSIESVQPLAYVPFTFFDFVDFKFVRDYWDVVRPTIDGEDLKAAGDTYFVEDSLPDKPDLLTQPAVVVPPDDVQGLRLNGLEIHIEFRAGSSGMSSSVLNRTTEIDLELVKGGVSVQPESDRNISEAPPAGLAVKKMKYNFGGVGDAQLVSAVRLKSNQAFDSDIQVVVRVHEGKLDVDRDGGARVKDLNGSVISSGATFPKEYNQFELNWIPASDELSKHAAKLDAYNAYVKEVERVVEENARRTVDFERLGRNLKRLQRLLLRRRHFYTRVILNAIEPEEIIQLLEAMYLRFGDGPHDVVPLSAIAHTVPLGATPGAFVLRLKPLSDRELDRLGLQASSSTDLHRLVNYARRLQSRFDGETLANLSVSEQVFLPTGGLFAEAVLGRSNAAEYLDVERFFNWQDAPIPNEAPAVQPPDAGSRYQVPNVSTAGGPSTISLAGPVALPDPTGMQGILAAVQNGNMFRDMSKAAELAGIVSSLSALSGQMGQAATKLTGDAQQQAMQAAAQAGQAAANLAQSMATQASQQAGATLSSMTQQGAMLNQAGKMDAATARKPGTGSQGDGGAGSGGDTPPPVQYAQASVPDVARPSLTEDVFRRYTGTNSFAGSVSPGIRQGDVVRRSAGLLELRLILANFDVADADLKAEHKQALEDLLELARSVRRTNSRFRVRRIVGHASNTGSEDAGGNFIGNLALSVRRAQAVLDYLKSRGDLAPAELRLDLAGVGSRDPIVETGDHVEEAMNRSVEIVFSQFSPEQAARGAGDCSLWKINTQVSFAGLDIDAGKRVRLGNHSGGFKLGGKIDLGEITCVESGLTRRLSILTGYLNVGIGLELIPDDLSDEMKTFLKVVVLDRLNISYSAYSPEDAGKFFTSHPVSMDWFDGRVVVMLQSSAVTPLLGGEQTAMAFFDPEAPAFLGGLTYLPGVTLSPLSFEISAAVQIGIIQLQ